MTSSLATSENVLIQIKYSTRGLGTDLLAFNLFRCFLLAADSLEAAAEMIQMYLAFIALAICVYFKYKYSFWARKKIDGPAPYPIFGNLFDFVITKKKHFGEIYREIYE